MKGNNILLIYAHLDDETILSYGTICKLCKNNNIKIIIVCGKGRHTVKNNRFLKFKKNLKNLNVSFDVLNYYDTSLTPKIINYEILNTINKHSPNIIFTHSIYDMHYEHRLIAEEVLLQCRKKKESSVQELYTTISPTYNWTYGQFGQFQPNYFIDITEYINKKKIALQNYNFELPDDNNDVRSVESIIDWNRQFGRTMNVKYCEAYQQIFKLV